MAGLAFGGDVKRTFCALCPQHCGILIQVEDGRPVRYVGQFSRRRHRFLVRNLDRRMSLGSDFPEYTPAQALAQFDRLTDGLPEDKVENVR